MKKSLIGIGALFLNFLLLIVTTGQISKKMHTVEHQLEYNQGNLGKISNLMQRRDSSIGNIRKFYAAYHPSVTYLDPNDKTNSTDMISYPSVSAASGELYYKINARLFDWNFNDLNVVEDKINKINAFIEYSKLRPLNDSSPKFTYSPGVLPLIHLRSFYKILSDQPLVSWNSSKRSLAYEYSLLSDFEAPIISLDTLHPSTMYEFSLINDLGIGSNIRVHKDCINSLRSNNVFLINEGGGRLDPNRHLRFMLIVGKGFTPSNGKLVLRPSKAVVDKNTLVISLRS